MHAGRKTLLVRNAPQQHRELSLLVRVQRGEQRLPMFAAAGG
jgi:hypothetical protein